MSVDTESLIVNIKELLAVLPQSDRAKFASKLSAVCGGDLNSVGGDKTDKLAAARDALGATRFPTAIEAAAANPAIVNRLKVLRKDCGRIGYDWDFGAFDLIKFNSCTAGRDPTARMAAKREANLLGLCE